MFIKVTRPIGGEVAIINTEYLEFVSEILGEEGSNLKLRFSEELIRVKEDISYFASSLIPSILSDAEADTLIDGAKLYTGEDE